VEKPASGKVIAYLGKGGTGKTVACALTARHLLGRADGRVLLIDADPAMGLLLALGPGDARTIAEARDGMIREARSNRGDKERLSMMFDYLIMEALQERDGYSLLVMGASNEPGCFCPLNSLLREGIEELSVEFDYIVIDAEAGIEQVNRQVTRRVDWPIIVTDSSLRGVATARAIIGALERSGQPPVKGVVFNRASEPDPALLERLAETGVPCLGAVPYDDNIARADLEGRSLLELPKDSPALPAFRNALAGAGVIEA
jgi:CO dehydrogenase maturation factor